MLSEIPAVLQCAAMFVLDGSRTQAAPTTSRLAQRQADLRAAGGTLRQSGPASLMFIQGSTVSINLLHGVLAAARQLGAALLEWRALPEQGGPLQLKAAQAAAARSCAYLRCANLAAEGGPAAGQGVGRLRCR